MKIHFLPSVGSIMEDFRILDGVMRRRLLSEEQSLELQTLFQDHLPGSWTTHFPNLHGGSQTHPKTGWWFQGFLMFTPTWGNDPIWLIFFKCVETISLWWCHHFWPLLTGFCCVFRATTGWQGWQSLPVNDRFFLGVSDFYVQQKQLNTKQVTSHT